ncbi:MAG: ribonucleoside-triphosphate reductase, adenosylcobalamin-dependent, partial [Chthoniobacterales bacterium]|nr:ribonucleoside-triphosphate reductase, adenosylcobalamin-dependent [Chthoniobacterales bacterium]
MRKVWDLSGLKGEKIMPSDRSTIVLRRTYSRHKKDGTFETFDEIVDRVIEHQRWLWMRARKGRKLTDGQEEELAYLRRLMGEYRVLPAGRTLWLGGTDVAREREASMFNCAFTNVETVSDVVDAFWLLLQGCGVGFRPIAGTLNGFAREVEIGVVRSGKTLENPIKGDPMTRGRYYEEGGKRVWHLTIGDSAEGWAKAVGKLLANKEVFEKLVLDFSEIRPAGYRLARYGWISSGDVTASVAFRRIAEILSKRADQPLAAIDILDILNHLGAVLSSRRSAQIALLPFGDAEWRDFAYAKRNFWENDNFHRQQSNNSLIFEGRPTRSDLEMVFAMMQEAGGSEPGFVNGAHAKKRAFWWKGVNPCCEILLPNKGFCNLVEVNLAAFNGRFGELLKAVEVIARANYRQTCVNLRDGLLVDSWHENNQFLRLCGVGVTGVVQWDRQGDEGAWAELWRAAWRGANSMAEELGLPRPKAVTTIKPSGTLSKVMDTTEGIHRPLGRYIINNIRFARHAPLVGALRRANYRVFDDPSSPDAV